MKAVDQLKKFILEQDVIPQSIRIHPEVLLELEADRFVYKIGSKSNVKRFMGIELIPSPNVKEFEIVEKDDKDERWIVRKEVKRIRKKYVEVGGDVSRDISLLFAYLGYLERELEDKINYINYLKQKETSKTEQ